MKKQNFGKIERIILFGGGQHLPEIIKKLKRRNIEIFVFLSMSQAKEINNYEKKTYSSILKKNKINFQILKSLKKKNSWQNLITKNTLGISISCRWIFNKKEILLFKKSSLIFTDPFCPVLLVGVVNHGIY